MNRIRTTASAIVEEPFRVIVRVQKKRIVLRLIPDVEDGGFVVESPSLRGLHTQGDSIDEAIANGREAALALLTEPPRRSHG